MSTWEALSGAWVVFSMKHEKTYCHKEEIKPIPVLSAPRHECVWGSGNINPHVLNLDTK